MLTMHINHPDIEKFATIKQDLSKVTGANISIKLTDEFMEAVKNDGDFIQRFPCDAHVLEGFEPEEYNVLKQVPLEKIYLKKIRARELWNTIVKQARDNAEPGLLMWDTMVNYSPDGVYEKYKPISTNPCVTFDTPILTDKGVYPIIELIGQPCNVWNGKEFSKVIPAVTGVNQRILKIILSDGRTLRTTPYHKFYTWEGYHRDGKRVDKEAKDLVIGDKLMKYNLPVIEYGETDNKAYSQGFYSGDGVKNSSSVWLYGDKINVFKLLLGKVIGNKYTTYSDVERLNFKLDFKPLPKDYVPINEYSVKSRLDWLAGLLDSDGTITNDKGLQITNINKDFLLDVQTLLTTVGVNSKVISSNNAGLRKMPDGKGGYKEYMCKETHRILIGAYQVKELIELGLQTHRIDLSGINPDRDASRFVIVTSIEEQDELEDEVFCFNEPKEHSGIFNGVLTGQCSEIAMSNDSCRLMAINLFSFVTDPFTKKANFDFNRFYKVNYEAMRLMDNLVDLELESVERILKKVESDPESNEEKSIEIDTWKQLYEMGKKGRRTGLGFTALGDTLSALGVKYDSDLALDIVNRIMNTKMESELDSTIDMSITRGTFDGWDNTLEYPHVGEFGNDFYEFIYFNYNEQVKRMQQFGRRNISWSTVAPTGSLSILAQTSSGIEPLFQPYYTRRKKINPGEEGVRVDFVDQVGDSWQEFPVLHPKFKDWINTKFDELGMSGFENLNDLNKEDLQKYFEKSPWYGSTANDIDWDKRVDIQSIIQSKLTHSISSTVNLPNSVTNEEVGDIYFKAWEMGLKGITVYRDGSRSGVLITDTSANSEEFNYIDAFKRPKEVECFAHKSVTKGVEYKIIVGLVNNKPYEVFIHQGNAYGNGVITKKSKGNYMFTKTGVEQPFSENITANVTSEQAAIARLLSFALRHGGGIDYAVKVLDHIDDYVFEFIPSLKRILKKYINSTTNDKSICSNCGDKSLIYEEGCSKCLNCGDSKCS